MSAEFAVEWNEDGDATVLGRVCARNGSGSATGVAGEGNWLQVADISAVHMKVFDLDSETPDTPTNGSGSGETITVNSSLILDTPVTTRTLWTKEPAGSVIGYNFIHDLAASYFPAGNRRYRVEYKFTLSGGAVFHGSFTGQTRPIRSS